MIPLLTPPPSPPTVLKPELAKSNFEADLAFVVNQERVHGKSFAYNLPLLDLGLGVWYCSRRIQIFSSIPVTPDLYVLSDSSTCLQYVVHHLIERVDRATEKAKGKFPDEFRAVEPLLGAAFVRGMELAFERRNELKDCRRCGRFYGLLRFLMWTNDRVTESSECNKISYEACVAEEAILPLLREILSALKKADLKLKPINEIVAELETKFPFVGSEVRIEIDMAADDASRIIAVQSIADRYKRWSLYGELPPFLVLHPYPPRPAPSPPPPPPLPPVRDIHIVEYLFGRDLESTPLAIVILLLFWFAFALFTISLLFGYNTHRALQVYLYSINFFFYVRFLAFYSGICSAVWSKMEEEDKNFWPPRYK